MNEWIDTLLALFQHESIEYALFAAAFISATLLPGGSEVVLVGAIAGAPDRYLEFVAIATLGNTLGSMTGYAIGRFIPEKKKEGRALRWLHRYGIWAMLFCWLPLKGDALSVAAGWLRLNPLATMALIAAGKAARYLVVGGAALPFAG